MSEFDEEAERERLREKYERDQEKRETTEKMSELLLQGATMTNAHCSECNDPIFRYDGQEFCASCEKPVDRDTGEEGGQDGAIEVTTPSDEARVKFGGDSEQTDSGQAADGPNDTPADGTDEPATPGRDTQQQPAPKPAGGDQRQQAGGPTEQPTTERRQADDTSRNRSQGSRPRRSRRGAGESDVGAVRDSLVRTLRRFSERAEECEDPQRAREHLAAAREAAETLEALRR